MEANITWSFAIAVFIAFFIGFHHEFNLFTVKEHVYLATLLLLIMSIITLRYDIGLSVLFLVWAVYIWIKYLDA
jgi:hypothetical protein